MSDWAIQLQDVTFAYGTGKSHGPWVLQGLDARVTKGQVFTILGPNGRGKTTLLHLLLRTVQPTSGTIQVHGRIGFVPQLFQVSFPYTVLDMVLMGRARHVGLFSLPSRQDEAAAWAALERMGIADLAARPFDQLSGGQRQLVIFARALATQAEILVLDEPTSALDLKNQGTILEWMARLSHDTGLTVICTSHHPHHALAVADEVLLLFGPGETIQGPASQVLSEPHLERLYGAALRKVAFDYGGRTVQTLVPVYAGVPKRQPRHEWHDGL